MLRCRRFFLEHYPRGFNDAAYVESERAYVWSAHDRWCARLRRAQFRTRLDSGEYGIIAKDALAVEARAALLSREEIATLQFAVRSARGAHAFANGLWAQLYGNDGEQTRFEAWAAVLESLPRQGTHAPGWPIATVFAFIASPQTHVFLRPEVVRRAALAYGFDFHDDPRPNWRTYISMVEFAEVVRRDLEDLGPRDMIDLHRYIALQATWLE